MNLQQAIFKRKSVRKYSKQALAEETLAEIETIIDNLDSLADVEQNIYLMKDGTEVAAVMSGLIGSFAKVKAPHYLAVTAAKDDLYLENAGFMLEEFVLELTSRGLATCWLGGQLEKEDLAELIAVPAKQELLFAISFGQPKDETDLYRTEISSINRKELAEIVINEGQLAQDEALEQIFKAVRVAPSAVNSQPWRFQLAEDQIHVFREQPGWLKSYFLGAINRVDIGIALKHLELAAKQQGLALEFKRLEDVEREDLNYIISAEKIKV